MDAVKVHDRLGLANGLLGRRIELARPDALEPIPVRDIADQVPCGGPARFIDPGSALRYGDPLGRGRGGPIAQRHQAAVYRARESVGERLLRIVQREAEG